MRQFIDVTGKTEDEAIQNALRQLGLDRDDVSVEILERAKSGFLGLGSCPAKVRVSYGPEEEEEDARQEMIQADRQKRMEEAKLLQEQQRQQAAQKKSLKEKRQAAQEAKALKAKKAATSTTEAGRVGDRPYARGRSYKEDRYDDQ